MPGLGNTLKDQQIADVITYARGAWNNTGAPVSVEAVAAVRAAYPGRVNMWTYAELTEAKPYAAAQPPRRGISPSQLPLRASPLLSQSFFV